MNFPEIHKQAWLEYNSQLLTQLHNLRFHNWPTEFFVIFDAIIICVTWTLELPFPKNSIIFTFYFILFLIKHPTDWLTA